MLLSGVGGDPLRRRFAGVSYRDGGDGGGPEASAMLKPKLELGKTCDKEEEERKLKLILRCFSFSYGFFKNSESNVNL